jgi:hypothetical protein
MRLLSFLVAGACYGASVAPQPSPMRRPAGGGGRPASRQRSLPELARNVGVIAVLIVVVAGIQSAPIPRQLPVRHAARASCSSASVSGGE